MNQLALVGGTAILQDELIEDSVVLIAEGKIKSIGKRSSVDLKTASETRNVSGKFVSPGFIDMHVHGGAGFDFMDGSVQAVETACRAHLTCGTTTIFPTTATGAPSQIHEMISSCKSFIESKGPKPRVPGIHLYGPFFAEDKVGCHSRDGRRNPTVQEYLEYFDSDFVRIATCAAELEGASDFYKMASERECLITCGHSNSTWAEMQLAFELGMRHVDHFWCAMSSVASLRPRVGTPMQASMAEFVLMNPEMSTEVIADGWHLSPELLEFAFRMLGPDRLCLVTDCNRALGMPPGDYRFGNEKDGSWFKSDGKVGWAPDGNSLASSIVGLDHMVQHMFRNSSASLPEVIRMASLTPARRTHIDDVTGSIETGKSADLLILSSELAVEATMVAGNWTEELH